MCPCHAPHTGPVSEATGVRPKSGPSRANRGVSQIQTTLNTIHARLQSVQSTINARQALLDQRQTDLNFAQAVDDPIDLFVEFTKHCQNEAVRFAHAENVERTERCDKLSHAESGGQTSV